MSDQGDAQRWHPVSNEPGTEPDDPTGPIPVVREEEPGFPPVGDEPTDWSAETTGGFPSASQERAPFEPADPIPAEEQSFSALRRSLAERLARYTEPEGGWPDPPSADPTPPFGTTTSDTEETSTTDEKWSSYGGSALADQEPERDSSYGFAEETVLGSSFGSVEDSSAGTAFLGRESSEGDSSYGFAEETVLGSSFGSVEDSSAGTAFLERESSEGRSPYGFAEETVHDSSYGFAGKGTQESSPADGEPYRFGQEEQDAENEFFGSDDHPPVWDKVVAPAGPPPKPGKPSSGNMRLPEWMKDGGTEPPDGHDEERRRSRLPLYSGIGVLVLGLLVAGGVVLLKNGDDAPPPVSRATSPTTPATGPARTQREKVLARFRGPHTRPAGRIVDRRAGLSYPRLRAPWAVALKKGPLSEIGFSMSQFAVTERAGGLPKRWGRLMSAELTGAEAAAYHGPGTERAAAQGAADLLEARMYAFRHRKRLLASQPLNIDGHKGWLVGYYLTYHRPRVRATAEVFTVAVVDTGAATPGLVCMTVPNTDRRLWPDINYVMRTLEVL